MKIKIGVIGLWHLGCVISASWSKLGYNVVGFDYDNERIEKLKIGIPPLFEPQLQDAIKEGFMRNLLTFTQTINDLSNCDFIFLSYDTPVRDDDSSETTILIRSINDLSKIMKDGAIVIISSQSPVGFCSELKKYLVNYNSSFDIAYSPENLRLGEAISCYLHPERIILGTDNQDTEKKCLELFREITENVLTMNLESAEMVKHGINCFLAMSIVFANNLADVCEENKARIDDVIKGLKSDPRIGIKAYLSPGIGFSGGTLGRDLKVLDEKNKKTMGYAKLFGFIHEANNQRKIAIVDKVKKIFGGSTEKTIGILGLTYKPGTSTLRRSLPLEIIELLVKNRFIVNAFDPMADYSEFPENHTFSIKKSIEEVSSHADMLLLLTEWHEFKIFPWETITGKLNSKIFYDTKNFLDEIKMQEYGFKYYSIGRG